MKKAYNETWVKNLYLQQLCDQWFMQKLISSDQNQLIKTSFPQEFYLPRFFVRVGLFIFASLTCGFFAGFISISFLETIDQNAAILCLICSISFFASLEYLIKSRKLFHSGIDNALLYAGLSSLFCAVIFHFENRLDTWQYSLLALVPLLLATYRYADVLAAAGTFLAILTLFVNLTSKFPIGKDLLPFTVMALSVLIYKYIINIEIEYYQKCRQIVEVLALATIYLGGNYYVVREGNALLNNLPGAYAPQIAYAPLFYLFTAIIPVLYIYFGLRAKKRLLLVTGLFCLAISITTLVYYTEVITIPQAFAIFGAFMVFTAAVLIHHLKTPKFGISDLPESDHAQLFQIQSILAAEYLSTQAPNSGYQFGGEGNFSGGGAEGNY